jgi:hypothetical protein
MYLRSPAFRLDGMTELFLVVSRATRVLHPCSNLVNVVLRGEFSGERSGVREYAPGGNGVAERYGDPVGV